VTRIPDGDRRYWIAVASAGVCGIGAALLPGLRLGIDVSQGGGDTQVAYTVWRNLNFAWGAAPLSSLYLLGTGALALIGFVGLRTTGRLVRRCLAVVVIALTATAAVHMGTLWDQPPPQWPVPHAGGGGCQTTAAFGPGSEFQRGRLRCGGALLAAPVDDFLADTGRAHPELDSAHPYRLEPLVGAWTLWLAAVGVLWWTLMRACRIRHWVPRLPLTAIVGLLVALGVVAVVAVAAAAVTGLAENCGNGVARWECSDFVGGVAVWIFLLASASFVSLVVAKTVQLARVRNDGSARRPL
jgi:hypothetical protein